MYQHTDALQTDHLNEQSLHSSHLPNCWFARDVTAAMLVVKNKSISLLWELNSIFIKFFEEIFFCFDPQHARLITWLQTKNCIRASRDEVK